MRILSESELPTLFVGRCPNCDIYVEFTREESEEHGREWNMVPMRRIKCPNTGCYGRSRVIGTAVWRALR